MNRELVTIHIVAKDGKELDYSPSRDGRTRSTETKINVLKVSDGYSVVFDDDVFMNVQPSKLIASLVTICSNNLKDTIFDFRIIYHYEGAEDSYFDPNVAKHVLDMDILMTDINDSKRIPVFGYTRLEGIADVASDLQDWNEEEDPFGVDEYDDEEDDDDDEDDEYGPDDFMSLLTGKPTKKSKKEKNHDYYGRSRVWKNSKQPKRQIHRHGVLIAADKSDLKKDEKIIKEFLKDFLPGKSGWKKEFREDVLERWMRTYAISRKNLKHLERKHRKNRTKKSDATKKALQFTNRLFSVPIDRWYDPSR